MKLVTGGSGMLGALLAKELLKLGSTLSVSRNASADSKACDLSDPLAIKELFRQHAFSAVIHCAGFTDVDGCEKDAGRAWKDNAETSRHLARACGAANIPFVYVSTDYVFDGNKGAPYVEGDATGPVNLYGMTKLAGEYFVLENASRAAIVRTSWLFGPGNPKNFVNAIAQRLKTEPKVSVLDDQIDSPTSIQDLSQALIRVTEYLLKNDKSKKVQETFHFSNAGITTRLEMARFMAGIVGRGATQVERTDPSTIKGRVAIRPANSAMSSARYEKFFGARVRSWQEALTEYLKGQAS